MGMVYGMVTADSFLTWYLEPDTVPTEINERAFIQWILGKNFNDILHVTH